MAELRSFYPLRNTIQHYDWGGYSFLPRLTGHDNPDHTPWAELWMGAHPKGPSSVVLNGDHLLPLPEFIARTPAAILSEQVARAFGNRLPFLFKVLDVRQMLSIQSHPNKASAERGFADENARGIPIDAFHRNFRDDNHKPEIMVALTECWLLHGFQSWSNIQHTLRSVPEFEPIARQQHTGIRTLYEYLMRLDQEAVDRLLLPLRDRLQKIESTDKNRPEFWAKRAFQQFQPRTGATDRGIFSIFLMNIVRAEPGQGIFQDAGTLHAYLEGVNVELMANSDNVFRGGLTPKHIDVDLLLENLDFAPVTPNLLAGKPVSPTEIVFPAPAPDFRLSIITLMEPQPLHRQTSSGPEIWINLEGTARLNGSFELKKGASVFIPAGMPTEVALEEGEQVRLFKASVPTSEAN